MDPNAACQLIADALAEGDQATARAACADLLEWMQRGGFRPGPPVVAAYVATRQAIEAGERPEANEELNKAGAALWLAMTPEARDDAAAAVCELLRASRHRAGVRFLPHAVPDGVEACAYWQCTRCDGLMGGNTEARPNFCVFGCDGGADRPEPINQFRERAARYAAKRGEG